MTTRFAVIFALSALLAASISYVVTQTLASRARQETAPSPTAQPTTGANVDELTTEDLLPMTCAQAWAAAGKRYPEMLGIVRTLAKVSLANRDLDFPNSKEAGWAAGKGIAADCKADPQGLLFAIVDKHVRRVAEPADRE